MIDNGIVLKGLDGSNPLAFLAALGTLQILDRRNTLEGDISPGLSWCDDGRLIAVLHGLRSMDEIVDSIMDDLNSWKDESALTFTYTKKGKVVRDLKPPPGKMHDFLQRVAKGVTLENRRSADMVAAYGSEIILDNNGNVKPTAFHFTAGQQSFIKMALELRENICHEHLIEALKGPWVGNSKLPGFSWDATTERIYALRASDPSKEKRGSVPGAEWLAFIGLACFPVSPQRRTLFTTGIRGGWHDGVFTWPIWSLPATIKTIRSLLAWEGLPESSTLERRSRGVSFVFSSKITRTDRGGYGIFRPAEAV